MKLTHLLSAAVITVAATAGSLSAIDNEFAGMKDNTVLKMRATHYKKEFTRLNTAPKPIAAPAKLTAASDLYMLITDDMDGYINHVKPLVVHLFNDILDTHVITKHTLIAATVGHLGDGGVGDNAVAAYEAAVAAVHGVGAIGDGGAGDAAIAALGGGVRGDAGVGDAAIAAAVLAHGLNIGAANAILDAATATGINGAAHPMGGAAEPASVSRGDVKAAFAALVATFDDATLGNPGVLVDSTTAEVNACKDRVNTAIFTAVSNWLDQVVPGAGGINVFAVGHALPSNTKDDVKNLIADFLANMNK